MSEQELENEGSTIFEQRCMLEEAKRETPFLLQWYLRISTSQVYTPRVQASSLLNQYRGNVVVTPRIKSALHRLVKQERAAKGIYTVGH